MILKTLWRADQETEQPIAQARQALHKSAKKKTSQHVYDGLHQTQEKQAWTGLTLELSGGCRDEQQSTATDPQPSA
jgi:hypothetical protein